MLFMNLRFVSRISLCPEVADSMLVFVDHLRIVRDITGPQNYHDIYISLEVFGVLIFA